MATTKITNPELFDLGSLNTALRLPSGSTDQRPTSPSTGEWRYNTTTNLVEFYDGADWRDLQSENIPPTASENFNTVLWTGNGSGQSITGVGYAPDFVWLKNRSQNNYAHRIFDTSRGVLNVIKPSSQNAQSTDAGSLTAFDSDGFTLGNDAYVNNNGDNFVGWTMKVNGGTTVSNTDGSVTSTVQLNSKTKFSIVEFQGAIAENSVGHGLGVKPEVVIVKELGFSANWNVYYDVVDGSLDFAYLNNDNAGANSSRTMWTSSVFYWSGNTTTDCVAYCFSSVAQFSKFGSYTGTGSATNKPIINTGFEPAFVMIKAVSTGGSSPYNWNMYDNKRNTSNPRNKILEANTNDAEITASTTYIDFLSNGFQIGPATSGRVNGSGVTYLYMAFASDPSTAPVLADSFANKLYTGTGVSGLAVTGLGFRPSMVWIKNRDSVRDHNLADIVQGVSREITPNTTEAQENRSVTSFDSDGFTLDNASSNYNANGDNYVAWNWKANPIPTINTDGTIQSIASANQASGFSIVKYTGDGTSGSTVGHNLGTTPEVVIYKRLDAIASWIFKSTLLNTDDYLALNLTDQVFSDSGVFWNGTAPTSTVFTLGNSASVNASSGEYMSYCFISISGFSKIGTYTGNGSTQSITGLGFQPSWLLIKNMDSARGWQMFDSSRGANQLLFANSNSEDSSEPAGTSLSSFDSDGFTVGSGNGVNESGDTLLYMAFKENPTPQPLAGYMSFLVVAGGASGGRTNAGGAGGGGLRTSYGATSGGGASAESDITLAAGTYTITVGAGGAALASSGVGNNGVDSSIAASSLTTITSTGGGGGYGNSGSTSANSGGSGGGAGTTQSNTASSAGSGTANQGFDGGARNAAANTYAGGGGGGASAAGQASTGQETGGNGGAGLAVAITGSAVDYAGGGGGGGITSAGSGGAGGGTAGGLNNGAVTDATANTGGGSGGTRNNVTAGSGGSGVVILRLLTSEYSSSTTGSPTVTTDGDYTVLTYTGSGTYVHS